MNAIRLISLAACGMVQAAPPMTARFENGDSLSGTLTGITEDSFTWKSDYFPDPQALKLRNLVEVALPGNENIDMPEGDHIAVVTLTNDDVVRGSLTRLDSKEVHLRTSFAGDLVFRRDMVASLNIEDKPEIFFAGPNGLDEWQTNSEGDWSFERGELVSLNNASISRDIGKRDRFRIAFDVEWRGYPRFRVFTCADNADLDEVGNSFELVCQRNYAYMRKRTMRNDRKESVTIGTTSGVKEFQEREKVRVELLHDLVAGRIRFILGGRVVADWREPAPGAGNLGGMLHFMSESGKEIRISRIRVTSWDGTIDGNWMEAGMDPIFGDEEPDENEASPESPSGIILRNGDMIEGNTVGIDNGVVSMKTELGEFELPVSRLRSFALRTAEEAANPELTWKPILRKGDIRAHFTEGDHITFQLVGFGEETLRGKSQTFGEAEFDVSAFSRLEFNLYTSDFDDDW
ncbi:hypothetical protein [Haloferula sp.]|uniref:hypothetical protein n=1 Tax=Haloferula sp. TaxID=2497595 RepID=UPI003C720790